MIPMINASPYRRLTVDALMGGVNCRDAANLIKDNQLLSCRNMEYRNGMLRSRAGFTCSDSTEFIVEAYENKEAVKIYTKKENFAVIGGKTYFLTVIQDEKGLNFRYCAKNDTVRLVQIPRDELPSADFTCNIFQYGADIYCICSGYYAEQDTPYYIFKVTKSGYLWEYKRLTEGDMYVPLIFVNGKPYDDSFSVSDISPDLVTGDMIEGYNSLSDRARFIFSSTTSDAISREDIATKYILPQKPKVGSTVKVNLRSLATEKNVTHTVTVGEDGTGAEVKTPTVDGEPYDTEDELCLLVEDNYVFFEKMGRLTKDETNSWVSIGYNENQYLPNNVEIEATLTPDPEEKKTRIEKIVNMTASEWFGGGSEGIYGGIHLFLGGNTSEKDKALVCWSDFNKPLYFAESGYTYVGDKAQRVTTFGKQGESLIILKEKETYATKYVSGDAVSAEAVAAQSVIDLTVSEVTFPMTQVNGYIGCDCPNTVQLCRNRLVWANSDGRIYTLVSANQWNERSILEVSDMIREPLSAEGAEAIRTAISEDFDGRYMLFAGKHIYVMDYNSYGYSNVAYYSKSEDAQINIPWWIWDIPKYPKFYNTEGTRTEEEYVIPVSVISTGNRLYMWGEVETVKGSNTYIIPELFTLEGDTDLMPYIRFEVNPDTSEQWRFKDKEKRNISCLVETKLFDFGAHGIKKSIPKAEFTFGNNGGEPIYVTVITDIGEDTQEILPDGEELKERRPGYYRSVVIRNDNKLARLVGYRIESDAGITLGGISFTYKILRGTN